MSTSFTLVQLRYFRVVAQLASMTAAARELDVAQSTLSSAVNQLERELGVELFVRTPDRRLHLTAAGRRLVADSQALLEQADLLKLRVRQDRTELAGELVVGVFSPLAPFRAPVILQAFEAQHPAVRVTLLEGDQATLRNALQDGRCEIALMYDLGLTDQLDVRVVQHIPPHVIVGPEHPAAADPEGEVSLRRLADDPFILFDLPHTRDYFLSLFQLLGVQPVIRHRASGYETVRSFVARGHGYSLLNQRLHQDLTYSGGRVVPLRIVEDLPPVRVLLASMPNVQLTARARAFMETTQRLYGVQPTD